LGLSSALPRRKEVILSPLITSWLTPLTPSASPPALSCRTGNYRALGESLLDVYTHTYKYTTHMYTDTHHKHKHTHTHKPINSATDKSLLLKPHMHYPPFTPKQQTQICNLIPNSSPSCSLPGQVHPAAPSGTVPEEYLRGLRPFATSDDLRLPSLHLGLDPVTAAHVTAAAAYYHPAYLHHLHRSVYRPPCLSPPPTQVSL
jgi:hypothetical protein